MRNDFCQFLRHWLSFAVKDATSAAFGWAAVPSGAVLAVAASQLGFKPVQGQAWSDILLYALAGAGAGWVVAFVLNLLVFSPLKALYLIRPFVVEISDQIRAPDFIFNDKMRGYNATLLVKNRSTSHLMDCAVHIDEVTDDRGLSFSRFVEKFDLPPKTTKHVLFAYWFSREPPHTDDDGIGLNGPVGAGFGGNVVRLPMGQHTLHIRVQVPDYRIKRVSCQVWVDPVARRLNAKALNDY
jgi:hypothetical protein